MVKEDGTIIINTHIDIKGFSEGAVDAKTQFGKMSQSANKAASAINSAFNGVAFSDGFSKSVETAKLKVSSLESELESVSLKLKEAIAADDDKSAARLGAQQEKVYDRLVIARQRLEIEAKAAAERQAEAERKAVEETERANTQSAKSNTKAIKASDKLSKSTAQISKNMSNAESSTKKFGNRIASIAASAFIFNVVSSALRKLTDAIGEAIMSSEEMQNAMANLKGAAYTAASPLISVLSSALTTVANAAARALSYITQLYSLLSGKSISAITATAEQMGNVSDAAGSAAKNADKAKKSLAGFDEINALSAQSDTSSGSGSGTKAPNYDYGLDGEISPALVALSEKIKELLAPLQEIDFKPLQKSLSNLGKAFKNFGGVITENLEWAWFNILAPLAEWTIEELAPEAVNLLADAFDALALALEPIFDGLKELWDEVLKDIFEWLKGKAIDIINNLSTQIQKIGALFEEKGPEIEEIFSGLSDIVSTLWEVLEPVLDLVLDIGSAIFNFKIDGFLTDVSLCIDALSGFVDYVAGIFTGDWERVWEGIKGIFSGVWDWFVGKIENIVSLFGTSLSDVVDDIHEIWIGVKNWFDENVITPVSDFFTGLWEDVASWASDAWADVKSVWYAVTGWFDKNIIQPISTAFSNLWIGIETTATTAWQAISDFVTSIWEGITGVIKGAINGIIGFLNGLVSGVCAGINGVIKLLNKLSITFPDWLPGLGGKSLGFNIGLLTAPQIPYLASGAVIPPNAPFMAVLGDQRHGTNIEAPLSTIQEAVAVVMEDMVQSNLAGHEATVSVLQEILQAILGIEIGDTVIGQATARYNQKMAIVRGVT